MSSYTIFNATTSFQLADPAGESIKSIEKLIDEHMDDYPVDLADDGDGTFSLEFDGGDVGDSFPGRVEALVGAMAPHVTTSFLVSIRNESMSDDNTTMVFGGPSQEAIDAFKREYMIKEAMELLRNSAPDAYELLHGALSGGSPATQNPKVLITVEGGVIQSVVSDQPADIVMVDYDADIEDGETLIALPQVDGSVQSARCTISAADLQPSVVREVAEIIAGIETRMNAERARPQHR